MAASESGRAWPPEFRGGVETLAAYAVVIAVLLVAVNVLVGWLGETSRLGGMVRSVPWKVVEASVALLVLRHEGVRLREIGLSPRLLLPALVAGAGVVVALNAAVAVLVALGGERLSVAAFASLQSPPLNYSPTELLVGAVVHYLFVGPAEELAFRGYLQNKLVALLGGGERRSRTLVGIGAAGVVFSLAHVPSLVVGGGDLSGLAPTLALLAFSGVGFGVVYETTRNLYLVALLHGFGNHWPLLVDPGAWPNWPLIAAVYAAMVLVYRRWATRTPRPTHGIGVAGDSGAP